MIIISRSSNPFVWYARLRLRSEEWAIIASLLIEVQCRSRPRWLIQPGARRSADSQLLITAIVSTCTGKFSKPYTYTYFCLSLPNLTVLTSVWYRFTKYKQYFYHSISSIAKIGLCAICLDIIFLVNSWTLVGATYESHPWSLTPVYAKLFERSILLDTYYFMSTTYEFMFLQIVLYSRVLRPRQWDT